MALLIDVISGSYLLDVIGGRYEWGLLALLGGRFQRCSCESVPQMSTGVGWQKYS